MAMSHAKGSKKRLPLCLHIRMSLFSCFYRAKARDRRTRSVRRSHGEYLRLIPCLVFLCNFPYNSAWYPGSHHICRNIFRDDTAGANDGIIPNGDTLVDMYSCANPDIVPDFHRLCIAGAVCSFPCIYGVIRCVNSHSWTK